MILSIIAAVGSHSEIGKENALLWHLPNDFQWFKKNTTGKPIIMGRKTYESIGKPLPNRRNVVLSRTNFKAAGIETFASLDDAIKACELEDEVFVIGGEQIYKQALAKADRLYLTQVQGSFEADAFFPTISTENWHLTFEEHHSVDEKHHYSYTFQILEKKS